MEIECNADFRNYSENDRDNHSKGDEALKDTSQMYGGKKSYVMVENNLRDECNETQYWTVAANLLEVDRIQHEGFETDLK